ncbi:recombinase family protein [Arthrobacter sp. FW306-07-I]|nr:recombinase family protein [Arthrobacter sp. FW306-07-I]
MYVSVSFTQPLLSTSGSVKTVPEGVKRQISPSRSLVSAKGWTVAREYVDNETSAAKHRGDGTALAAMLSDLTRGAADLVVAVDLDSSTPLAI